MELADAEPDGIGPMPSDLAITYNEDQNLGVGVPYTRAAEFRVAYHVNEHWAMGVGIEDSNQYIGNYVALPAGFSSIGSQFDNNANAGAANLMPDIIAKTTYDTNLLDRHFHAELTGFCYRRTRLGDAQLDRRRSSRTPRTAVVAKSPRTTNCCPISSSSSQTFFGATVVLTTW